MERMKELFEHIGEIRSGRGVVRRVWKGVGLCNVCSIRHQGSLCYAGLKSAELRTNNIVITY